VTFWRRSAKPHGTDAGEHAGHRDPQRVEDGSADRIDKIFAATKDADN